MYRVIDKIYTYFPNGKISILHGNLSIKQLLL